MNIDVGQAIQVVANIGVVASIVLLAFQLKQNNKLMAATAAGVNITQATVIWSTVIEQPEMAELLIKDRQHEAFTPAQEMRLNAYWIRSLLWSDYCVPADGRPACDSVAKIFSQLRISAEDLERGNRSGERPQGSVLSRVHQANGSKRFQGAD